MDRKDLVERKTEKGKLRESKVDHIKLQKRWEVMGVQGGTGGMASDNKGQALRVSEGRRRG